MHGYVLYYSWGPVFYTRSRELRKQRRVHESYACNIEPLSWLIIGDLQLPRTAVIVIPQQSVCSDNIRSVALLRYIDGQQGLKCTLYLWIAMTSPWWENFKCYYYRLLKRTAKPFSKRETFLTFKCWSWKRQANKCAQANFETLNLETFFF